MTPRASIFLLFIPFCPCRLLRSVQRVRPQEAKGTDKEKVLKTGREVKLMPS